MRPPLENQPNESRFELRERRLLRKIKLACQPCGKGFYDGIFASIPQKPAEILARWRRESAIERILFK